MWKLSSQYITICFLYSINRAFSFHPQRSLVNTSPSLSSVPLQVIKWPFSPQTKKDSSSENGIDPAYPWRFEGRFIFRPSLVRLPKDTNDYPPCSQLLSIFGYTLGGSVVLEYDVSPVGPYREYVNMGGLVALGRVGVGESLDDVNQVRCLGLGQWGTNLYVSTVVAEDVCREVWGVPAALANIEFEEDGDMLQDGPDESADIGTKRFNLSGWGNSRILLNNGESQPIKRFGNIPIFWTPTIKALWAPISFPFGASSDKNNDREFLPVHKLRLSASALRLKRCVRVKQQSFEEIPLGLALVVDNVLIEIGRRVTTGGLSIVD